MKKRNNPEELLQIEVCNFLRKNKILFWSVPNEAVDKALNSTKANKVHARNIKTKLVYMGMRAGVADLSIVHDGKFYGLELKSEKGRLSPHQKTFQKHCLEAGAEYAICRSLEDVLTVLSSWGII